MTPHDSTERLVRFATAYDEASEEDDGDTLTVELPEDLTELSDEDLAQLQDDVVNAFDALYQSEEDLSQEDVDAMQQLADAAEAIRGESNRREQERQENREAADALANRVRGEEDGDGDEPAAETDPETDPEGESEPAGAEEPEPVTAGGAGRQGPISVTLSGMRRRQQHAAPREEPADGPVLVASGDLGGTLQSGQQISTADAAHALSRRVQGVNEHQYVQAYNGGRRLTNSFSVAAIPKNIPEELTASGEDASAAIEAAADEHRLPGGSLTAAGGWCSPSETVYDLFELESDDGLVSVPEIGVSRGGIRHTPGPDFASLFAQEGFAFTETEDEAGAYSGETDATTGEPIAGDKPCFRVACPAFQEHRLSVDGLCITAGLLQNRAYPEVTERTIRGALTAHQHRMAGKVINAIIAGSTAVALPANQAGATAPVLTAIEVQAEHYRHVHRMARGTTLEAIIPFWVRGVIRSDLSRRLGIDLFDVSDQRIGQWFSDRGIQPQYVYNYQDLTGTAGATTAWPTEVRFLLYAAGTWVRGSSDLITMEALFDSALLAQNDFTALFTEEGWLMAMRGHDSREVTVPLAADGATHGGINILHDGTVGA